MNLLLSVLLLAAEMSGNPALPQAQDPGTIFPKDQRVVETVIAVEATPLDIAMSPDGASVFISQFTPGVISEIRQNKVVRSAKIGSGLTGLALSKDGRRIYAGIGNENALAIIDVETFTVLKKIAIGSFPIGVRLSPDESWVGAVCSQSNALTVVPLDSQGMMRDGAEAVSAAVGSLPYYISISPDSRRAYVTDFYSNTLSVMEIDAGKKGIAVSRIKAIPVGTNPVGVGLSPDGSTVYTANWGSSSVTEISTKTLEPVKTHTVGSQPYYIAIHPQSSYVMVSNFGADQLDVLYADGRRTRIKVKDAIINVFISPNGKRIYTTAWNHAAVGVIE